MERRREVVIISSGLVGRLRCPSYMNIGPVHVFCLIGQSRRCLESNLMQCNIWLSLSVASFILPNDQQAMSYVLRYVILKFTIGYNRMSIYKFDKAGSTGAPRRLSYSSQAYGVTSRVLEVGKAVCRYCLVICQSQTWRCQALILSIPIKHSCIVCEVGVEPNMANLHLKMKVLVIILDINDSSKTWGAIAEDSIWKSNLIRRVGLVSNVTRHYFAVGALPFVSFWGWLRDRVELRRAVEILWQG